MHNKRLHQESSSDVYEKIDLPKELESQEVFAILNDFKYMIHSILHQAILVRISAIYIKVKILIPLV